MILSQDTLTVALVALALDAVIGWPDRLYRRISHPVVWLGGLITALDRRWNRGAQRITRGALAASVVIGAALIPAMVLTWALAPLPLGTVALGESDLDARHRRQVQGKTGSGVPDHERGSVRGAGLPACG